MSQTKVFQTDLAAVGQSSRSRKLEERDLEYFLNALLAAGALLFLAPLMIVISLMVFLHDGGPIFFAHRRVGRGGRSFPCLKFRSMATDAEARLEKLLAADPEAQQEWAASHKLRADPRITRIGDFLRRSSLDELPQLLNVLRGDMSLVGPRPVTRAELQRYGEDGASYLALRPGLTGKWQVSGRNEISYSGRVALDSAYARDFSIRGDLTILLQTVGVVLGATGK